MTIWQSLPAIVQADFRERIRRGSFRITLCLVLYLGYSVGAGQIQIQLGDYQGVYNSAWVGSLMALVAAFFLGLFGFHLVKNAITRDERTGVGQIIATTPITRPVYLLGKWMSNVAVLSVMAAILGLAAILIQFAQGDDTRIRLLPLFSPFLLITLPALCLVSALAVFFESVQWLKGGFGNLMYFFVFFFLLVVGVSFPAQSGLDIIGLQLVGSSMKAAAAAAYSEFDGGFVLTLVPEAPRDTFVWSGLDVTAAWILQRLTWIGISFGLVLAGSLFFNRFDPKGRLKKNTGKDSLRPDRPEALVNGISMRDGKSASLTPLDADRRFQGNILQLIRMEFRLMLKGIPWYWLGGMAFLWVGSVAAPAPSLRNLSYLLAAIWPVLLWSGMGGREARHQTEQLIFHAPFATTRLRTASWIAGVLLTSLAVNGVLLGRLVFAEPLDAEAWLISVLFIPTLALTLGVWSGGSGLFEAVYPVLWILGPFNRLAELDFLGIDPLSPVHTSPAGVAGIILALLSAALLGRRRG